MTKTKCQCEFERWVSNDEGLMFIKSRLGKDGVSPWHEIYLKTLEQCWQRAWEAASRQLINKETNKLERRFKAKGKKDV